MTAHAIHVRIGRVVVDAGVGAASARPHDPATLAAAIAARLQHAPAQHGPGAVAPWHDGVVDAVAERVLAAASQRGRDGAA